MYDLVVARYNEDIAWLKDLDTERYKIFVYNKGEPIPEQTETMVNMGGDAQAYIYHIVKYYDELPEFIICIQAYPFDHCEKIVDIIDNHIDKPFKYLTDHIVGESINGWYEHLLKRRPDNYPITYLNETARSILGNECPNEVAFGAGQQFIVHRDIIRNRSKEFYQSILNRFDSEFLLPWHIERLWPYIFKVNYYD